MDLDNIGRRPKLDPGLVLIAMLRFSKMTDYGIELLGKLSERSCDASANTQDIAECAGLSKTTAAKILKQLSDFGLLVSQRGVRGGYRLARPATEITVHEVVLAIEGPIAMSQGPACARLSKAVCHALTAMTLAEVLNCSGEEEKGEIV
jgi:Rrf2 family protein